MRWTFLSPVALTRVPVAGLVEDVKKQVWSLDSQIPVSGIQSMDGLLAVSVAQQRSWSGGSISVVVDGTLNPLFGL